ncbi:hypothetical protein B0H10DRAFT_2210904 [Mycena sp. CBHHK59/15]|nr:hypothetical protein B0H10DRAFT_2210904 [Mycena sp. CBHHK59/15]
MQQPARLLRAPCRSDTGAPPGSVALLLRAGAVSDVTELGTHHDAKHEAEVHDAEQPARPAHHRERREEAEVDIAVLAEAQNCSAATSGHAVSHDTKEEGGRVWLVDRRLTAAWATARQVARLAISAHTGRYSTHYGLHTKTPLRLSAPDDTDHAARGDTAAPHQ